MFITESVEYSIKWIQEYPEMFEKDVNGFLEGKKVTVTATKGFITFTQDKE